MQNNQNFLQYFIQTTQLWLLPEKCLFLPEKKILIVADVHIGKVTHFRKHGIGVPANLPVENLNILSELITRYDVKQIVFLGDLFHSKANPEWDLFADWIKQHLSVSFILTEGNHDKHARQHYPIGLQVCQELYVDNLILTHEPLLLSTIPEEKYNLHGHIHPAVLLKGMAKQSERLPAFIFNPSQGILPAFGKFTGMANIPIQTHTKVFVIAEKQIFKLT